MPELPCDQPASQERRDLDHLRHLVRWKPRLAACSRNGRASSMRCASATLASSPPAFADAGITAILNDSIINEGFEHLAESRGLAGQLMNFVVLRPPAAVLRQRGVDRGRNRAGSRTRRAGRSANSWPSVVSLTVNRHRPEGRALQRARRLAEQHRVTGCRQRESQEEERDQENRHEEPRSWPRMPFLLMRVLVRLVTHRSSPDGTTAIQP